MSNREPLKKLVQQNTKEIFILWTIYSPGLALSKSHWYLGLILSTFSIFFFFKANTIIVCRNKIKHFSVYCISNFFMLIILGVFSGLYPSSYAQIFTALFMLISGFLVGYPLILRKVSQVFHTKN